MNSPIAVLLWCLMLQVATAQEFLRPLPNATFAAQLTQNAFPSADGVIVLKEQSLNVHRSEITYRGVDLVGIAMTRTTVLIAKVFNEAGVRRLGSFEFEYKEYFGNEIPAGFAARARVQKPDGSVIVMPDRDVSVIVSHQDKHGEPIARKALFKVPDLMPGDIVQLEYSLTEPFSRTYSGIFYY
ncbi:MAG: DUF3857 domain-containing protein [Bacteroidota bacterium]